MRRGVSADPHFATSGYHQPCCYGQDVFCWWPMWRSGYPDKQVRMKYISLSMILVYGAFVLAFMACALGVLIVFSQLAEERAYPNLPGVIVQTYVDPNLGDMAVVQVRRYGDTVRVNVENAFPKRNVGDRVIVVYDPANRNNELTVSFATTWLGTLVCLMVGVLFLVMGIGSLLFKRFVTSRARMAEILFQH